MAHAGGECVSLAIGSIMEAHSSALQRVRVPIPKPLHSKGGERSLMGKVPLYTLMGKVPLNTENRLLERCAEGACPDTEALALLETAWRCLCVQHISESLRPALNIETTRIHTSILH